MPYSIPIENLYYLLSYAWDYLREGPEVDVSAASCPDLENLLAKVLTGGIHRLARSGFERDYLPVTEITPRLKGRIHVAQSYRRLTHRSGKMHCEYDELSHDTPPNRILRAVARRMLKAAPLTIENRHALRLAVELLPPTREIKVSEACSHRIQLHRNTRNYRIVLSICRLIHQSFIPEEKEGTRRFRDILRDETVMHGLFEAFVRNFAKRHCPGASVSQTYIRWQATEAGVQASMLIPCMRTDVTIAWPNRKLILDCKYYRDALVQRDSRTMFNSSHLYQIHAYLTNQAAQPGWEDVEGMLLYPTNGNPFDHTFTLHGRHKIRISTIDLQNAWPTIEKELIALLNGNQTTTEIAAI